MIAMAEPASCVDLEAPAVVLDTAAVAAELMRQRKGMVYKAEVQANRPLRSISPL